MAKRALGFPWCSVAVLLVLSSIVPTGAAGQVSVDEKNTRLVWDANGVASHVQLAVKNSSSQPIAANLSVGLVDRTGALRAWSSTRATLPSGAHTVSVSLTEVKPEGRSLRFTRDPDEARKWDRLLYTLQFSGEKGTEEIGGTVAAGAITPELFVIRVAHPSYATAGAGYSVRIRAEHPFTAQPASGVTIAAELEIEEETLERTATTDARGYAFLTFDVPEAAESEDAELTVKATRGSIDQTLSAQLWLVPSRAIIATDKPIYQPGQELHLRALLMSSQKRAIANREVVLTITDPDGDTVFRASPTASRFGIVQVDWPIPLNQRLGTYNIEMHAAEDSSRSLGAHSAKISRYDLPNFTVEIKPNKPYYLPGENAKVEVRGDYLFGKPVKRGQVRVVRETSREWDYDLQEYEIDEGQEHKGELDANGRFFAELDLAEEHADLGDDNYAQFRDLRFAAYLTDETTRRTEQRRFDVRITRHPIHVYFTSEPAIGKDELLNTYISTQYADGTPCRCEVSLLRSADLPSGQVREASLRKLESNRYGLAKVADVRVPGEGEGESDVNLVVVAHDRKGRFARHEQNVYEFDHPMVRVATDKAIYRPGEPIVVDVNATKQNATLVVQVESGNRVVHSRTLRLRRGKAWFVLPYSADLKDEVRIFALDLANGNHRRYSWEVLFGVRTVLYPEKRGLNLDVNLDKASYKPGEEVKAQFRVRHISGSAKESALGVAIVDTAVEARARTEQEFGHGYSRWDRSGGAWFEYETIAGFTREDLDNIDLSEPVSADLDLLSEVILSTGSSNYVLRLRDSADGYDDIKALFQGEIHKVLDPLFRSLTRVAEVSEYPRDEESLRAALVQQGIDPATVRDPWSTAYRPEFSYSTRGEDKLAFVTAGPDKIFDTADDFEAGADSWPYFTKTGKIIDAAARDYHRSTGSFIRDAITLKSELRRQGVEFDNLRDRWGQSYRLTFGVSQRFYTIEVLSAGPNKNFRNGQYRDADDFTLWTSRTDYLADLETRLHTAMHNYYRSNLSFPQDESELRRALLSASLDLSSKQMPDHWGNPYYAEFSSISTYSDRTQINASGEKESKQRLETTPVTRWIKKIRIRSQGPDGKKNTYDDFDLASYSAIISEQAASDETPQRVGQKILFTGSNGGIAGTVTDSSDAVVTGVQIVVSNASGSTVTVTSDNRGEFLIWNLAPGEYTLRAQLTGFNTVQVTNLRVTQANVTRINLTLTVAAASEMVTVNASNVPVNTEMAQASVSPRRASAKVEQGMAFVPTVPRSTPRLREYFPETLLWVPEVVTDKRGRSALKFKVADNITSWKMTVWASNLEGQLARLDKQFTVFQPFFVDHDPPPVLTENDEIALPVVLRNYLAKPQTIGLEITPEKWFTVIGESRKNAQVSAGEAAREIFPIRAVASVREGKQRVTATGNEASDAIERKVSVHPDGEEQTISAARIFSAQTRLNMALPAYTIPGSSSTELKIYPNLAAHLLESVESVMRRPYGCAEQTISSTYPALLALRSYRQYGMDDTANARRALRYVQAGYDRLLSYQGDGGFAYWSRGEADVALTAYAIRFLNDAKSFVSVDENIIGQASAWLLRQQKEDGSWTTARWNDEHSWHRLAATAYVARVLATSGVAQPQTPNRKTERLEKLQLALQYLARKVEESDDPYAIASYALAAWGLREKPSAQRAAARLRKIAHKVQDQVYWHLQQNTPFYGWGRAGRIETTAIALLAITQINGNDADDLLLQGALRFLMQNKDRYGIWYSGQATVNVLDALLATLNPGEFKDGAASPLLVTVNGKLVQSVEMPPAKTLSAPLTIDLSSVIIPGTNTIELARSSGATPATAQVISSFYVPWANSQAGNMTRQVAGDSDRLDLSVQFDKARAMIGDPVRCTVKVQRIGFRGYGMMLAEIGLPPGADVDRASLDKAMEQAGWSLNHYDVLPDRLIAYVWPGYQGGPTEFEFTFRPRLGLKAQSAPSVLYDYYNPEARAVVKPVTFNVQ